MFIKRESKDTLAAAFKESHKLEMEMASLKGHPGLEEQKSPPTAKKCLTLTKPSTKSKDKDSSTNTEAQDKSLLSHFSRK